jgi:hypothetical protein
MGQRMGVTCKSSKCEYVYVEGPLTASVTVPEIDTSQSLIELTSLISNNALDM